MRKLPFRIGADRGAVKYFFASLAGLFLFWLLTFELITVETLLNVMIVGFALVGLYLVLKFGSQLIMAKLYCGKYAQKGEPLFFRFLCWAWRLGPESHKSSRQLMEEGGVPFATYSDGVRGAAYLIASAVSAVLKIGLA